MTKSQEKTIERIKRMIPKSFFYGSEDAYEVKRFETRDCEYFVSVVIETGLKGDEGTVAEFVARDRAHLFVGKHGGITYPVNDKKSGEMRTR